MVNIITTSLSTVNKVPCTKESAGRKASIYTGHKLKFRRTSTPPTGDKMLEGLCSSTWSRDLSPRPCGNDTLATRTALQPTRTRTWISPHTRRSACQPADGACACYAGHATPLSPPLLIAINGPDTWIYYCIEIVIYDVSLTAHELTSRGHYGSRWAPGGRIPLPGVSWLLLSLAQQAEPSAVSGWRLKGHSDTKHSWLCLGVLLTSA